MPEIKNSHNTYIYEEQHTFRLGRQKRDKRMGRLIPAKRKIKKGLHKQAFLCVLNIRDFLSKYGTLVMPKIR